MLLDSSDHMNRTILLMIQSGSGDFALEIWRYYLFGDLVQAYIDHKSLKYSYIQKELNMRQREWLELVVNYGFDTRYCLGKVNIVSDALSQRSIAMYLTQQKKILEHMDNLGLEIVYKG